MRNESRKKINRFDERINEIALSLESSIGENSVYILVEGKDDCKIYSKFLSNNVKIEFVGGGKPKLLASLELLRQVSDQIIGICDADFERLMDGVSEKEYLFFTDHHDIEMTMLSIDGVFHNILCEYELQDQTIQIKDTALRLGSRLAYWRWYNEINHHGIKFERLPFGNLIVVKEDDTSFIFEINEATLIEELNKRSAHKKALLCKELLQEFEARYATTDLFNLCNGHDIMAIIALMIGMQTPENKPTEKRITECLRLSFQFNHFKQTLLYTHLYQWQESQNIEILTAQ